MKKIKILILISFFLTGCINYTELNDIGIVTFISIGKEDNDYLINVNMSSPTLENKNNILNINIKTNNINTLTNDIYVKTSKKIDLSHLEVLSITKDINKSDIDKIINYFNSITELRTSFLVIYSNDTNMDSKDVVNLIRINSENNSIITSITYDDVLRNILEFNLSYIPIVDKMEIKGYHSIYEENKELSISESMALNFIYNKIDSLNMSTSINYKITSSNTLIRVNKNNIILDINCSVTNLDNNTNIKSIVSNDIYKLLTDYLYKNKHNYFYSLIEKYNYNYYSNNKDTPLIFTINIKVLENN